MPRDTYHDFVTYKQLAEARWPLRAKFIMDTLVYLLACRSGARNVTNGIIHFWDDAQTMTRQFSVSFDSAAWTGRHG